MTGHHYSFCSVILVVVILYVLGTLFEPLDSTRFTARRNKGFPNQRHDNNRCEYNSEVFDVGQIALSQLYERISGEFVVDYRTMSTLNQLVARVQRHV
jgi:hypothetical protein